MKRILLACLVLILTFSISGISFAATTDSSITITDEQNAAAFVYPDIEPLAEAAADVSKSGVTSVTVAEENVPTALPKTGGIPEEAFYAIGGIMVICALVVLMKKSKTAPK